MTDLLTADMDLSGSRHSNGLTAPCFGNCGDDSPHDSHLTASWDGDSWVPDTDFIGSGGAEESRSKRGVASGPIGAGLVTPTRI